MKKKIMNGIVAAKSCIKGTMPRLMALGLVFIFGVASVYAADSAGGTVAIGDITTAIKNYEDAVRKLLYAIAAIIALVGAFNIYNKMTNGDQDVKKTAMLVIGGCIAMVALAQSLPAFFSD